MNILFFRHGLAEDPQTFHSTGFPDEQRPLTKEGKAIFARFLSSLQGTLPTPNLILASPLVRTQQTAQLIQAHFGIDHLLPLGDLRPGGNSAHLFSEIAKLNHETVYLIGHNPDMSYHVNYFFRGDNEQSFCRFREGGFVWLNVFDPIQPGVAEVVCALNPVQLKNS